MTRIIPGFALLLTAFALPAGCGRTTTDVTVLGDFEGGRVDGWEATSGVKASVVRSHAATGRGALQVLLPVAPYPGVGVTLTGANKDWSDRMALRFSAHNASKTPVKLCIRIDDDDSIDYATRYNGDGYPHVLKPGDNQVEVTVAALRQGSFGSRGLDVSRLRLLRLFAIGLKEPATLCFDNLRLVGRRLDPPRKMAFPRPAFYHPFTLKTSTAENGAAGRIASLPGEPERQALRLTLPPTGTYPGLRLAGNRTDWLDRDLLHLRLICPAGEETPKAISVKVADTVGRRQTVSVDLVKGANDIYLPLEMFGEVSLGKVEMLQLFIAKPPVEQTLYIASIALFRAEAADMPTVHGEWPDPALTLDMSKMKIPRNTCFMATIHIPLPGGRTRVVRCNSAGQNVARYSIARKAFEGMEMGRTRPVRVWLYVSDHGSWRIWARTVEYIGKPVTVEFVAGH